MSNIFKYLDNTVFRSENVSSDQRQQINLIYSYIQEGATIVGDIYKEYDNITSGNYKQLVLDLVAALPNDKQAAITNVLQDIQNKKYMQIATDAQPLVSDNAGLTDLLKDIQNIQSGVEEIKNKDYRQGVDDLSKQLLGVNANKMVMTTYDDLIALKGDYQTSDYIDLAKDAAADVFSKDISDKISDDIDKTAMFAIDVGTSYASGGTMSALEAASTDLLNGDVSQQINEIIDFVQYVPNAFDKLKKAFDTNDFQNVLITVQQLLPDTPLSQNISSYITYFSHLPEEIKGAKTAFGTGGIQGLLSLITYITQQTLKN